MVTLPMTFFSKTPIECTPHPKNFDQNITEVRESPLEYPDFAKKVLAFSR